MDPNMSLRSSAGLAVVAFMLLAVPTSFGQNTQRSLIRGVAAIDAQSAVAYTRTEMLVTRDSGTTWQTMPLDMGLGARIASVHFLNANDGLVVIVGGTSPVVVVTVSADRVERMRS